MPSRRRQTINSRTKQKLEHLPPCDGPKLHSFAHQNAPIEWFQKLNCSEDAGEGYVFKVRIKSHMYALKVVSGHRKTKTEVFKLRNFDTQFKFYNPEDTRWYWERLLDDSIVPQIVAYHTDPFYAECRAYGRINEAIREGKVKRDLVVPCRGYLFLREEDRRVLEDRGVDLEEDCLDDGSSTLRPEPIRAIVKDLAGDDSGVSTNTLGRILGDIKQLNKLKIYNRDIRKENYRGGKLVDFGSSRTEPHCFMQNTADKDEARETRTEDLVRFDDMVLDEGFKTALRGMPNWGYCKKLRSRSKRKF